MSFLSGSGLTVWVLNLSLGFDLPVEGHFHNEFSFWVRSSCLVFESELGFGLPVWGHFHNESSFWVRPSCWVFEFLFGLGLTCLGTV